MRCSAEIKRVGMLLGVKGSGEFAAVRSEGLSRLEKKRDCLCGLQRWQSGSVDREQGISQSGNRDYERRSCRSSHQPARRSPLVPRRVNATWVTVKLLVAAGNVDGGVVVETV